MMQFNMKAIVTSFITLLMSFVTSTYDACSSKLNVYPLEGKVEFTDTYKPDASMLIPAAYTSPKGTIEGQYRINGVIAGNRCRIECVSIHPTKGLLIGKTWQSKNGFQQHVLVNNNKARTFKDPRYHVRRALCCDNSNRLYIVESRFPVTLNKFAEELSGRYRVAVNLDMGPWGYGWVGDDHLFLWAYFFKGRQTSWIYCK